MYVFEVAVSTHIFYGIQLVSPYDPLALKVSANFLFFQVRDTKHHRITDCIFRL